MSKLQGCEMVAWGSNVMVRVKNPEAGAILLSTKNEVTIEPKGVVMSTGKLVRGAADLINRSVVWRANNHAAVFGEREDEYIFVLINEAVILAVEISEDDVQGVLN